MRVEVSFVIFIENCIRHYYQMYLIWMYVFEWQTSFSLTLKLLCIQRKWIILINIKYLKNKHCNVSLYIQLVFLFIQRKYIPYSYYFIKINIANESWYCGAWLRSRKNFAIIEIFSGENGISPYYLQNSHSRLPRVIPQENVIT